MSLNANEIGNLISQYSYLGIFLWFLIFDQLTPIPEEVSLIALGYIAIQSELNPIVCGLISLAALITIDNLYYILTYKGTQFAKQLFENQKKNNFIQSLRQKVHDNSWGYLFLIELIPRFRILSPVIACMSNIGWKKFNLINTIATAVIVGIYIFIGIFFNNGLKNILKGFETARHIIFAVVLASVFLFIWRFLKQKENN